MPLPCQYTPDAAAPAPGEVRCIPLGPGGGVLCEGAVTIAGVATQVTLAAILARLGQRLLTDAGVWAYGDPITPSDSLDLTNKPARGIYVAVAGTVKFEVLGADAARHVIEGMFAANSVIPFAVYKVWLTGTSATVYDPATPSREENARCSVDPDGASL